MRVLQERSRSTCASNACARHGAMVIWLMFVTLWTAQSAGAQVRLPLNEYHDMMRRAESPEVPIVLPAAPFAVERAELEIELGEATAASITRYLVSVFAEGWQRVPIRATGRVLSVEGRVTSGGGRSRQGDETGDSHQVRLASDGGALLIRGVGLHEVTVTEALPLIVEPGSTRRRREIRHHMPEAASVAGSIRAMPGDTLTLQSGGAVVSIESDSALGDVVQFVGIPGSNLHLMVLAESERLEREDQPLRFSAQVYGDLHLRRSRAVLEARVQARVLQGSLETLKVGLPAGYEVEYVSAGRLTGWDLEEGVLIAELLSPTESSFTLSFRLVAADPGASMGQFRSPVLSVPAAVRSRNQLSTVVHGAGILELVDIGAAVELDAIATTTQQQQKTGLDQSSVQRTAIYQLTDLTRPPQWSVMWPEQTEVLALRVDTMVIDALVGVDGKAVINLQLQVANRGAQTIEVELPDGFELVRCERDGNRVRPGVNRSGDGGEQLVLALDGGTLSHRFAVLGVMPIAAMDSLGGGTELRLPLPPISAPVSDVLVRAQLPDGWRYRLREASISTAAPALQARAGQGALLDLSPGFVPLYASWSAMSAQPGDLLIEVLERRSREEWF